MSHRRLGSFATLAAVTALVSLTAVPVAGQVAVDKGDTRMVPRTPDGHPDLQGVWDYRTLTPLERPDDLAGKEFFTAEEAAAFEEESVARQDKDRRVEDGLSVQADVGSAYNEVWWDYGKELTEDNRTALIVDPPDGRVPYVDGARDRMMARFRRTFGNPPAGPEDRSLWERCITLGVPRLSGTYNNNFQLFQTAGHVVILNEMIHDARIIPLDGSSHVEQDIQQWLGDSRGHWDGDTLVVNTTNFTDKTNFRGAGENLHLVERFTRVDADTLLYEVTVDDPTAFTSPWTFALPMLKNEGLVYEYACHEGNYGMTNLLKGARAEDKAAKEAAPSGP